MNSDRWHPLHDAPAFPSARYASIADRIGKLLKTEILRISKKSMFLVDIKIP